MTTATKTAGGPALWLRALYTIPRVDPAQVDPISRWLILGRVSVVVMTAISAVIGGLLALRDDVFDAPLLALVAVGLVLAHTGSNLVNDFWDYRHGIDTPDSPRVTYGPHPMTTRQRDPSALQQGSGQAASGESRREFLLVTAGILGVAAAIGIYLTVASGPEVLIFALSGAAVLLFYSGGPLPLKHFGLGEIAVFIVWGPLMIGGTYYVMAEHLPLWVILASVPYGLGVTSVLFGKHLDKLAFDSSKGIRTMPIVLGEALARRTTQGLCILMYAAAVALVVWQEMPGLLLVFGALPLLLLVLRFYNRPKPERPPEGYRGWPLWFVGAAFVHNRRFGLLFVGGLALQLIGEAVF
ncbi:MAG: prenyltransferase [Chloroflexi bacterium]|nr:prenyltransferase [Chloroflexota bacterium]